VIILKNIKKNLILQKGEQLSDRLEFPREIVLDMPKITITGESELEIENHKGIVLFQEKEVKINSKLGLISINGSNFEILFMGGATITIKGNFKSVSYLGYE